MNDTTIRAGGFLLAIFGAFVLGMSPAFGLSAGAVRDGMQCGAPIPGYNTTAACVELITAMGDMALWTAIGGVVAFGCGLVVFGWSYRE